MHRGCSRVYHLFYLPVIIQHIPTSGVMAHRMAAGAHHARIVLRVGAFPGLCAWASAVRLGCALGIGLCAWASARAGAGLIIIHMCG